ncbi:MAG: type II toxin-antitoxin system Phd/YefM family antitoxin [Verrucomicrobia bacterium]|nr:type II toxin-antitoxin system Phd/YefM family antitoxin [Verrucomicrobiota bacterium]
MKLVNISQAKTHLSSLIEAVEQGEEVMILRGSRPAVTLLKVTEADLHFNPEISMKGLEEFDSEIERDRREGALLFLGKTGSEAVDALKRD